MRFQSGTLFAAALLVALAASAAMAADFAIPGAVPGPIAGAGLGYLVLAGGYYVVRRWRKQNTGGWPRQFQELMARVTQSRAIEKPPHG
jgi:hypothetical protein